MTKNASVDRWVLGCGFSCALLSGALMATIPQTASAAAMNEAPASVASDSVMVDDGIRYVPNADGGATVAGMEGTGSSVVIPETLGGLPVTAIGSGAFKNVRTLKSIQLPGTVTTIGEEAFYGCDGLTEIALPSSVTAIGESAFYSCDSLSSIVLPNGIREVPSMAFFLCRSLESIVLPDGLTRIGASAFSGCSSLCAIDLPEGLTRIGNFAFSGCSSLESVEIPGSVISIDSWVFQDCSSLSRVAIYTESSSVGIEAFKGMAFGSSITVRTRKLFNRLNSDGIISTDRTIVVYEQGYPMPVESLTLDRTILNLSRYSSYDLVARVAPADIDDVDLSWTSSNPSIVSVDEDGHVYARAYGSATITVETEGMRTSCEVTVAEFESLQIGLFDDPVTFEAEMEYGQKERWEVSDPHVLAVTRTSSTEVSYFGKKAGATVEARGVGTATLRCYVDDVLRYEWTITVVPGGERSIEDAEITGIRERYELTGESVDPTPVVTMDGKVLSEGVDYTLSYRNNRAEGDASVVITGIGRFTDSVEVPFEIVGRILDIAEAEISGIEVEYALVPGGIFPVPTVMIGERRLTLNTDFSLTYENNTRAGVGRVVITGIGEYFGSQSVTFRILNSGTNFADVDPLSWYFEAVSWAAEHGVFNGYGDGGQLFGPLNTITRAEMAQVLWNRIGRPEADADLASFSDVDSSGWYADAVAWCLSEGIFQGYGDTFGTERPISREEVATVLWRLSGEPESFLDLSSFSDASSVSEYAVGALSWAVENRIVNGKDDGTALDPQGRCTRAEVAAMLMRMGE